VQRRALRRAELLHAAAAALHADDRMPNQAPCCWLPSLPISAMLPSLSASRRTACMPYLHSAAAMYSH
jgi:hypothetical protein